MAYTGIAANHSSVSIGISADTGPVAVGSTLRGWYKLGKAALSRRDVADDTAACGGSNGARVKLWKSELQRLTGQYHSVA